MYIQDIHDKRILYVQEKSALNETHSKPIKCHCCTDIHSSIVIQIRMMMGEKHKYNQEANQAKPKKDDFYYRK